jgi:hypothetical protein
MSNVIVGNGLTAVFTALCRRLVWWCSCTPAWSSSEVENTGAICTSAVVPGARFCYCSYRPLWKHLTIRNFGYVTCVQPQKQKHIVCHSPPPLFTFLKLHENNFWSHVRTVASDGNRGRANKEITSELVTVILAITKLRLLFYSFIITRSSCQLTLKNLTR